MERLKKINFKQLMEDYRNSKQLLESLIKEKNKLKENYFVNSIIYGKYDICGIKEKQEEISNLSIKIDCLKEFISEIEFAFWHIDRSEGIYIYERFVKLLEIDDITKKENCNAIRNFIDLLYNHNCVNGNFFYNINKNIF